MRRRLHSSQRISLTLVHRNMILRGNRECLHIQIEYCSGIKKMKKQGVVVVVIVLLVMIHS